MKISVINQGKPDYQGQFEFLHNAGFDACDFQLGAYFRHPNGKFADILNVTDEQIIEEFTKIKECADSYGIEIFQTHGTYDNNLRKSAGEELSIALSRGCFLATKALGAKYCIQHPFIHLERRYDVKMQESIDEMITIYKKFIPALKETGVICCLENMHAHDKCYKHRCPTVLSRAQEMADVCDALGEHFAVCLDTGHCLCTQDDPVEAVKILGKRIVCIHAHDNDGFRDLHQYPFCTQGVMPKHTAKRIDWHAFMKALKDIGYNGTLNFETSCCSAPEELRPAFLKYLHSIGKYLVDVYYNA